MSPSGPWLSDAVASGTYVPFQGPINGSNISSSQYPLRYLFQKQTAIAQGGPGQIRYMQFGSSVAYFKGREIVPLMARAYGQQVGAILDSGQTSPSGLGYAGVNPTTTSGTVTANISDFDAWPSGLTTGFTQAATQTFSIGGAVPVCDHVEVYYVTGPSSDNKDGGSFSYAVDGGAATNVSTAASSIGLGIVSVPVGATNTTLAAAVAAGATSISTVASIPSGTAIVLDAGVAGVQETTTTTGAATGTGPYTIPVGALKYAHASGAAVTAPSAGHTLSLSWVSGACRIVGVGIWNSQINGVLPVGVAQGGINLFASAPAAFANLTTFLAHVRPDLITFEMKQGQVDSQAYTSSDPPMTAFKQWMTAVQNGTTAADVVIIGSTPDNSTGGDPAQLLINQRCAQVCLSYQPALNAMMWDGFSPLVSYAELAAVGWQGAQPHVAWQASQFLAGLMIRDLNMFGLPFGGAYPGSVAGDTITVLEELVLAQIGSLTVTGQDLLWKLTGSNGNFRLLNAAGNVFASFSSTGNDYSQIPGSTTLGAGNAGVTSFGPSSVAVFQNTSPGNVNTPGDLSVRSVALTIVTLNVSGTFDIDSTTGSVFRLTPTANSVVFTAVNGIAAVDGQIIYVHVIRGATAYTYSFDSHYSFTGGTEPATGSTVNTRDIYQFQYNGNWKCIATPQINVP